MQKLETNFGQGVAIGLAIALWLAIASWPYIYYTTLRWAVFLGAIYLGYKAFSGNRFGWLIGFVGVGVLFNPIMPIYLSKGEWVLIDIAAAFFFFFAYHTDFLED